MLQQGQQLDKYRIQGSIAAGGMGIVYRAEHIHLGTPVAVKVLLPNLAMNDKVRQRFVQEARVQSQLKHANIVKVSDFIIEAELLAFVMELVDGPSLEQVAGLERPGAWTPADALAVMLPTIDAVAYAHARGVVHRDLKPANVLLERAGQPGLGMPKITDFGLARLVESQAGLTRAGTVMGTLPYMAPEQFAGSRDVGPASDVFALGMMLWHLLVGALPVNPDNMQACTQMYMGQLPIPDLLQVGGAVPAALAEVVGRAVQVNPHERFPDAGRLHQALAPLVSGGGVVAPVRTAAPAPAPRPTPAARPPARPALPPTVFESQPQPHPAPALPDDPHDEDHVEFRKGGLAAKPALWIGGLALAALVLGVILFSSRRSDTLPTPPSTIASVPVEAAPAVAPAPAPPPPAPVVLCDTATHEVYNTRADTPNEPWLNLRSSPSSRGTKQAAMPDGTCLELLSRGHMNGRDEWYEVRVLDGSHAGTRGYAHSSYIRIR